MHTTESRQPQSDSSAPKEKRKGFHPVLVIATIAVVLFVLWFCPYTLMNARIVQTEEKAVAILERGKLHPTKNISPAADRIRLIPDAAYTDYAFFALPGNPEITYAIPEYYGKTAISTFCRKEGRIYRKDIDDITPLAPLPLLDDSWQY